MMSAARNIATKSFRSIDPPRCDELGSLQGGTARSELQRPKRSEKQGRAGEPAPPGGWLPLAERRPDHLWLSPGIVLVAGAVRAAALLVVDPGVEGGLGSLGRVAAVGDDDPDLDPLVGAAVRPGKRAPTAR